MPELVTHFIDGREVPSRDGRTFDSVSPATGEVLAQVSFGGPADVDRAAQAAAAAFEAGTWRDLAPAQRGVVLRRLAALIVDNADRIAQVEARDAGKPITQAREEALSAGSLLDYFSGLAEHPMGSVFPQPPGYFSHTRREPYGVVGAISPWNYPFVLACWKTAPALVVGNSVVLKVAEQAPLSTSLLAELSVEAGIPPGVFNVVHGDGPVTGAAIAAHPGIPKITFTGSTETGKAILRAAAEHVKSVHLELGGKTPNIVFEDADLERALAGLAVHLVRQRGPDLHVGLPAAGRGVDRGRVPGRARRPGRADQGRRPAGRADPDRPADLGRAARPGPRLHRLRRAVRGQRRAGQPGSPAGARPLRVPDGLHAGRSLHADRQGGDFRPRPLGHDVPG